MMLCATLSPTWAPRGMTARVAGSGRCPGGHSGGPGVSSVRELDLRRASKEPLRKKVEGQVLRKSLLGRLGLSGRVRGMSWEGLGRSWGDLGATLEAVRFRIVFLIDFERQKDAQREAFWEPKRSKNRSKNEVQIQERKSHLLESSWCDFGSISKVSWGQKC